MPDFIVIGGMKCATSTLHDQLAQQPGIFMSTPKEPNFFSDDAQYARGLEWYRSLFHDAAPGDLCGESSTHYTKLPTYPQTIQRLRRSVPEARFVYVMRHPIDRLVSHYVHEWTERTIEIPIDQAIEECPRLIQYSLYAMQLEPYFEAFGSARVLGVFFPRLMAHSQQELERMGRFIGYDGAMRWNSTQEASNVSAQRLRRSPLRDAIINLPGLKQVRRGLMPQSLRDRIKRLWMMKNKPQLSDASMHRLRQIFDEDLATLGRWIGTELNCENFNQVTRDRSFDWQEAVTISK